jgi:hypothetical protein
MTAAERLIAAQKIIERANNEMSNCDHKWKETIFDPETIQESVFRGYEGHGSDPYPVFDYYPKQKNRWSRECSKCGKKEYTDKQEAVIKEYKPKF